MLDIDLSKEALLKEIKERHSPEGLNRVEEVIKNWERYGGFEKVRDLLFENLFNPWKFKWEFCNKPIYVIDSSVDRYHLIKFLVHEGVLDEQNLKGKIVDIGCHLGATVDALALFGGVIMGTDSGKFALESPSGIDIGVRGGREYVKTFSNGNEKLSLVSCFNTDWVEDMSREGFALRLYNDALHSLIEGGQVLYTFSKEYGGHRDLSLLPDSHVVKLPEGLNKREDYAFSAKKTKNS